MRLENPWLLLLALPAAAALCAAWLFEADRAAVSFPGTARLPAQAASKGRWVRGIPLALKALALLLAVAALARPQKVLRQAMSPASGVDIMLVLDTSTSMRALDFDPLDRMGAAKRSARNFVQKRTSDRIGITVFGGIPMLACPLTLDYGALFELLDQLEAGMTQSDGTAIGDGIAAGTAHLKDAASQSKVMILITDGANNTGVVDPLTAAKTAKSFGIKVYAIGAGRKGPAMVPVDDPVFGRRLVQIPDELDEDVLLRIAAETGGRYFRAQSADQLNDVYAEIDRMERSEVRLPPIVSFQDLHAPLLLWAALLLAAEMLLSGTLLMRLP
jgi:Ca-activated chloride channel family protein